MATNHQSVKNQIIKRKILQNIKKKLQQIKQHYSAQRDSTNAYKNLFLKCS